MRDHHHGHAFFGQAHHHVKHFADHLGVPLNDQGAHPVCRMQGGLQTAGVVSVIPEPESRSRHVIQPTKIENSATTSGGCSVPIFAVDRDGTECRQHHSAAESATQESGRRPSEQNGRGEFQRPRHKMESIRCACEQRGHFGASRDCHRRGPPAVGSRIQSECDWHVLMSRRCIPLMEARGGGSIVIITSVAGLAGGNPSLLYPTTKAAIVGMTRPMASHHGGQNIRVNCVAPGLVYTPMVVARNLTEELREQRRLATPLQTEGTGWDVGEAVLCLASPASRWVTGVVLPVDGGLTSRAPMMTAPREKIEGVER